MKVAQKFADRLDRRDYSAIHELLADNCVCKFRRELVIGPPGIVALYRKNTEWAFQVFDRVEFESSIAPHAESSARLTFTDRLISGSRTHEFKCQQIVHANISGQIQRIVHCELAGESEALRSFFDHCGITPPK
jgi:hypothetical protein